MLFLDSPKVKMTAINNDLLYIELPGAIPVRDVPLLLLQEGRAGHQPGQVLRQVWVRHQAVLLQCVPGGLQEGAEGLQLLPEGHQWGRGVPCSYWR